jgi:hypothetical protein
MSSAVQFEQVAETLLYETRVPASVGWAGYVLPTASKETVITVGDSLNKFTGYYVFAVSRPPVVGTDPAGFANQVLTYVKKVTTLNRVCLWLQSVSPVTFGEFGRFGFQFSQDINRNFILRTDMNAAMGAGLNFRVLTSLVLTADDTAGELVLRITSTQPYIGFQKGLSDLGIAVGEGTSQRARIALGGDNTACLLFTGKLTPSVTFSTGSGLNLGFDYIYRHKTTGADQVIYYPGFNTASFPQSLNLIGTVDPSDPVNTAIAGSDLQTGHLRTGLILTGAPTLASNFRTPEGKLISLIATGASSGATSPPLMAGAFALATAAQASVTQGNALPYFAPAGQFGASVQRAGPATPQALMCGLFGSERVTFSNYNPDPEAPNDLLFFLVSQPAYAPVFPFLTATLDNPESGNVTNRLTNLYVTPWVTVFGKASQPVYIAEPEGSPIYSPPPCGSPADDGPSVLLSAPPRLPLPQGAAHTFPMVPYAGAAASGVDGPTLTQFESEIIAATRKTVISAGATSTWEARSRARLNPPDDATYGTTPQGLVAQIDESGGYQNVQLAQSFDAKGKLLPFDFARPTLKLQDALQTNQLFLVAVNNQYFDDPAESAVFHNVVYIADWTMKAQVGKGATATSYRNVMIMKFCSGSLQERVTNPNRWTSPADFSLLAGSDSSGVASIAYTGLSQWLQAYIADGIARATGPSAAFYKNFKRIATDPNWNGLIVLQADLSSEDMPIEIRGLAAGIDFSRFVAHHFGFTVSRVIVDKTTCKITIDGNSSLFGLIDYENPTYELNLANNVDPDTPIPVATSDAFNFTVLQLQCLFQNARLVDFKSHIQLTVKQLFGSAVASTYSNRIAMPASGVVLDGSYIDQNGTPSYVFQQTRTTVFALDSNVLQAVAFTRTQFNTLGEQDGGATVASRFVIWGAFDFVQLNANDGSLFDVLSFGSPPGTLPANLGTGLAFSNLLLQMTYPASTPNAQTFTLDTDNLSYDSAASDARDQSLFRGFGLQLKSFINAAGDQTTADYGFLPVTSTLNLKQLGKPWFGVVYQVTLGGPGALASAAGFDSTLLLAWSPITKVKDKQAAVYIGLSLPGAAPGAKLFSIQGVLKISIGSIALLRQPVPQTPGSQPTDRQFYCLRLDDIALKIFGIVKLPPDATIQFFLFGDPDNTGSLGWYAAYVADPSADCGNKTATALPPANPSQLPAHTQEITQ